MKQRDYWDQVADTKNFTTPFHSEIFAKYVGKDAYILDLGCGYGRTLKELQELGYKNLHGIDFSEKMIKRGKKENASLDLKIMKSKDIDLPDQSVEAVILFAVLTCITKNEDQEYLIKEIRRVLKPHGIVYVNDFLLNNDDRNIARYEAFAEKLGVYGAFELSEGAICRHHDEKWIRELFSSFHVDKMEHITFTTMNGHMSNGFYLVGEK